MREMDLIMGRFAESALEELRDAELADLERLIALADADLLAWVTGVANVPNDSEDDVVRRGPWPGNVVRRPRVSWSSAAMAPVWRRWRAHCRSSPLISRCSSFRPGTACPTTGSRRMPARLRFA